jgi:3,4-dihydroxy-2-butanone 4-phosphate synthase
VRHGVQDRRGTHRLGHRLGPTGSSLMRVVEALASGGVVVLHGSGADGGVGDVLVAAEYADAEVINFMVKEARGVVSLALTEDRCFQLGLQAIRSRGRSKLGDAAMVSIEARSGVTTGISAADRARTISVAIDAASGPEDIVQPGHVFPLRAHRLGSCEPSGRVEVAIELAHASGLTPAAVLCQVLRNDGRTADLDDLRRFAMSHGLPMIAVDEVIRHDLSAGSIKSSQGTPTEKMRDVMGHFATGVSVITAATRGKVPVATTANAITSVSLEPPLLLVCLANESETLGAIHETKRFAINMLSVDQQVHSERFAAKGVAARPHEVPFENHAFGVPVLPGALATIVCEVAAIHAAGDHEIVVGAVHDLTRAETSSADPLVFYRGNYSRLLVESSELDV